MRRHGSVLARRSQTSTPPSVFPRDNDVTRSCSSSRRRSNPNEQQRSRSRALNLAAAPLTVTRATIAHDRPSLLPSRFSPLFPETIARRRATVTPPQKLRYHVTRKISRPRARNARVSRAWPVIPIRDSNPGSKGFRSFRWRVYFRYGGKGRINKRDSHLEYAKSSYIYIYAHTV